MGLAYNFELLLNINYKPCLLLNIKNKFGAKTEDYYWLLLLLYYIILAFLAFHVFLKTLLLLLLPWQL
jgi:hypothetical protein